MATIQDRWHRRNHETGKLERTALYGTGKRYRPHFRDASGREVTKAFDRKVDAQRWLDERTAELVRGTYVHPELGRLTVGRWAETWIGGRAHLAPKTSASYRSMLRARVLPRWGEVPLSRVGHGDVVAWVAAMRADGLSASRTRQAYHLLTAMLDAAVKDGRLARNVASGVDYRGSRPPTGGTSTTHSWPISPTTAGRTGCSCSCWATPDSGGERWPLSGCGGSTCSAGGSRWPNR